MAKNTGDNVDKSHDKIWFLKKAGKIYGPMASIKMRHLVLDEKVSLDDKVSKDKKTWKSLRSVPEVIPLQMRDPHAYDDLDEPDENLEPGRKGSLVLPILVVVLLLASGIFFTLFLAPDAAENTTDCEQTPSDKINWNSCQKPGLQAKSANYRNLVARNINLRNAHLGGAQLQQSDLRYAILSNTNLSFADLTAANLKGADLQQANLDHAILERADLRFADFKGASLRGTRLQGALLDGALWTDGTTCKAGSTGQCLH